MKRIACLLVTLLFGSACFAQATKDAAQNPGFPRVVARLNLFNRTKAIGPQTLYTPAKSGVFRISGTMVCTIGNGQINTPAWESLVSWTNEVGQNGPVVVTAVNAAVKGSAGFSNFPFTFNAANETAITFSIVPIEDTSNTQYNAYIILEQLE